MCANLLQHSVPRIRTAVDLKIYVKTRVFIPIELVIAGSEAAYYGCMLAH